MIANASATKALFNLLVLLCLCVEDTACAAVGMLACVCVCVCVCVFWCCISTAVNADCGGVDCTCVCDEGREMSCCDQHLRRRVLVGGVKVCVEQMR